MAKKSIKFQYPPKITTDDGVAVFINNSGGYYCCKNGSIYSVSFVGRTLNFGKIKIKKLKPQENIYGYLMVNIVLNNRQKTMPIHRIVAGCYLGESCLQVDHIDRNKKNNFLENLRYVTPKENQENAKKGHCKKVLNEFSVLTICTMAGTYTRSEIAKMMGVHVRTIKNVCTKKTHIGFTENLIIGKLKAGKKQKLALKTS